MEHLSTSQEPLEQAIRAAVNSAIHHQAASPLEHVGHFLLRAAEAERSAAAESHELPRVVPLDSSPGERSDGGGDDEEEQHVPYEEDFDSDEEEARAAASSAAEGSEAAESDTADGSEADGSGGIVWHAQIVPDTYTHKRHCTASGELKPRRARPHIRASDFIDGLSQTPDGRWVFAGALNDWPGLSGLEVRGITWKPKGLKGISLLRTKAKRHWTAERDGATKPSLPPAAGTAGSVRATMLAPPWSRYGWSPERGFVFWCAMQHEGAIAVWPGESMVRATHAGSFSSMEGVDAQATCVRVHALAHRYGGETPQNVLAHARAKLTHHACVLLEWSHGQFVTVTELAWLNGLSGYGGKCNWYADKDAKRGPALYAAMPDSMKAPWTTAFSEIRAFDVPYRTVDDFMSNYVATYIGADKRFLSPEIYASADVRIAHSSLPCIQRYLLNYLANKPTYHEAERNCQTYAADLFAFLSGQHRGAGCEPYLPLFKLNFKLRPWWFLYPPAEQ